MLDVNDLLIFVRVVQTGSFSRAAKQLRVPKSTVSRRVAELEKQLNVPLLHRTTRSLRITDAGKIYFEQGLKIAGEIERTEELVTQLQAIPQGTLRVTAPTDFGNQFLGKIVREYLQANPRVKIDLLLTERVVDLIGEGFDLAIRVGELEDSSLIARRIGSMDLQLYASPRYLKEKGEPAACQELVKHSCIVFTGEGDGATWRLKGPRGEKTVTVPSRISANHFSLVREFAVAGEGIALMPRFLCEEDVRAGKLKPLLTSWVDVSGPIHAVYPGQRSILPKLRAFLEHLSRSLNPRS